MVHQGCDLEYAEQVTSEHKITERAGGRETLKWVKKATHADNHYLDCEVYAAAAADIRGVRHLFLTEQAPEPEKKQPPPQPKPKPTPEEGWIRDNENWV